MSGRSTPALLARTPPSPLRAPLRSLQTAKGGCTLGVHRRAWRPAPLRCAALGALHRFGAPKGVEGEATPSPGRRSGVAGGARCLAPTAGEVEVENHPPRSRAR